MSFDNPKDHLIELEKRLDGTEEQLGELMDHVLALEGVMMSIAEAVLPTEEFQELQNSDQPEE